MRTEPHLTNHTPGAMHAAKDIIAQLIAPNADSPIWDVFAARIAEIIDKESGLTELLNAARKTMSCNAHPEGRGRSNGPEGRDGGNGPEWLREVERAIDKATRP